MRKIAILTYVSKSEWVSCHFIHKDLMKLYKFTFKDEIIPIFLTHDDEVDLNAIRVLKEVNPEVVVFLDHRISHHPLWIMNLNLNCENKNIKYVIHAYGCFVGRIDEWIKLHNECQGINLSIIALSNMHADIIKLFLKNNKIVNNLESVFYFEDEQHYDQTRDEVRRSLGIEKDEVALVYAGRISFQKNVHHLVDVFLKFRQESSKKLKLFICGEVDDFNTREYPKAHYLNYPAELFGQALSKDHFNSCKYINHLDKTELHTLLKGMDCAISMSTFNGEDYGRFLMEGYMIGLNVIASRWGGHKDLEKFPYVKLINIEKNNGTIGLYLEDWFDALESLEVLDSIDPRDDLVLNLEKENSKKLLEIIEETNMFNGLTKKAITYKLRSTQEWQQEEYINLYEDILHPYWE